MITGLVLGKFHPLHTGHIGLIEFARKNCDELIVLICAAETEIIPGEIRLNWLQHSFSHDLAIKPILLPYDEQKLPNTSVSSIEASKLWADKIKACLQPINLVFSSEPYGEYLAHFLGCQHLVFDPERNTHPVSSTKLMENIYQNWNFLPPAVQPFFLKKICLYGTESTGKSTLTKLLANHFQTVFVPEMAREVIMETEECTEINLLQIAKLHAEKIQENTKLARRYLFVDTDLHITKSYSKFLFGKRLTVDNWIEEANQFDLYLFLDKDVPHIQDGTRLGIDRRNDLHESHLRELSESGIPFVLVSGNWQERFDKSVSIIKSFWK